MISQTDAKKEKKNQRAACLCSKLMKLLINHEK